MDYSEDFTDRDAQEINDRLDLQQARWELSEARWALKMNSMRLKIAAMRDRIDHILSLIGD